MPARSLRLVEKQTILFPPLFFPTFLKQIRQRDIAVSAEIIHIITKRKMSRNQFPRQNNQPQKNDLPHTRRSSFSFLFLASLIADRAACFARGLAGRLTLSAAAFIYGALKRRLINRLNMLHRLSPSSSLCPYCTFFFVPTQDTYKIKSMKRCCFPVSNRPVQG